MNELNKISEKIGVEKLTIALLKKVQEIVKDKPNLTLLEMGRVIHEVSKQTSLDIENEIK